MVTGAATRIQAQYEGIILLWRWLDAPPAAASSLQTSRPAHESDSDDDEDSSQSPDPSVGRSSRRRIEPESTGTPPDASPGRNSRSNRPDDPATPISRHGSHQFASLIPDTAASAHGSSLGLDILSPTRTSVPNRTEFVNAHTAAFSPMTAIDVPGVVKVIAESQKFASLVPGMAPQYVRVVDLSLFPELEATHTRLHALGLVRSTPFATLTNCSLQDFIVILCEVVSPTTVAAFRNLFLANGSRLIRCSKPGVPSVADFTEILAGFVMLKILVHVLGSKLGRLSSSTSDRSGEPSMVYTGGATATSFPLMILALLGPAVAPSLEILHAGNGTFPGLHADPLRWRFSMDSVAYLAALKSLVLTESQGCRTHAFDNARYEVALPISPASPSVSNPLLAAGSRARLASLAADFEVLAPYITSHVDADKPLPAHDDYRSLNAMVINSPVKPRNVILKAPTVDDLERIESDLLVMKNHLFGISGSGSIPEGRTADGRRSDRGYSNSRDRDRTRDDRSRDSRTQANTRSNAAPRREVRIATLESRPACYSWSKHSDCRYGSDCTYSHDSATCLEYLRSHLGRANPQDPNPPPPPPPALVPTPPLYYQPRGPSPSTLGSLRPDFNDPEDLDMSHSEDDGSIEDDDDPFLAAMAKGGPSPGST